MRVALCFLLALVAPPAWAEWVKVTVAKDGRADYYIDPDSIRKDGNLRKVWQIINLKKREKAAVMSWRSLHEFDCKEERIRLLAASSHSEPMAGGKTLWSHDDPGKWDAKPPDSAVEIVLNFVCAK